MRSTNKAPDFLSNSYFTGSPPTGTSMTTLIFSGGLSPVGMRSMFIALFLWEVPAASKHREAKEQRRHARRDRSHDVAGGEAVGMALDQQRGVERESGEGGEAAEDSGRQKKANVLGNAGAIG